MKKERIMFIFSLIIMLFSGVVSIYAVNCLYNSEDVSYDNSNSGLTSTNVQASLDELYGHCTDYTSLDTRVAALETQAGNTPLTTTSQTLSGGINELDSTLDGYFQNNTKSYFYGTDLRINGNNTASGGYVDFFYAGVNRAGVGVSHSNGDFEIIAKNSSGTFGAGNLNMSAASVKINNTSMGNLIKAKTVSVKCTSLTQGFNLSSYISLDSGYKFLAWESVGSSSGWVAGFPIYIAGPTSTSGGVYWNGSMSTSSNHSVIFTYFEILNV